MEISRWEAQEQTPEYPDREPGMMIRVSRPEALRIIESLTTQMLQNTINSGREEFYTSDGEYLSIGVIPEPDRQRPLPQAVHLAPEIDRLPDAQRLPLRKFLRDRKITTLLDLLRTPPETLRKRKSANDTIIQAIAGIVAAYGFEWK